MENHHWSVETNFSVTVCSAIIGIIVGAIAAIFGYDLMPISSDVLHPERYIIAGVMHTAGYLGALAGVIYGVIFQIRFMRMYTLGSNHVSTNYF